MFKRETQLKITQVESNGGGGTIVTLEKEVSLDKPTGSMQDIQEQSFVNLNTKHNITFSKGLVISKEVDFKPKAEASLGDLDAKLD